MLYIYGQLIEDIEGIGAIYIPGKNAYDKKPKEVMLWALENKIFLVIILW